MFTLVFLAEFGITYMLCLVTTGLKKKKISNRSRHLLMTWLSVFAILTALGIVQYFQRDDYSRIYIIHATWIFSMIVIILTILAILLIFSINQPEQNRQEAARAFSIVFLAGYLLFTLSNLDFYFFQVGIEDFDPLILLIINVLPAFWLHFYYAGQQKTVPALSHDDSLQSFYKDYNITPKEKEIIELIIEGNSNKDIENKLFISINTVKNHIYSIYRKAKVNSRLQLLKRIREYVSEFR